MKVVNMVPQWESKFRNTFELTPYELGRCMQIRQNGREGCFPETIHQVERYLVSTGVSEEFLGKNRDVVVDFCGKQGD